MRETILVARQGRHDSGLEVFTEWYAAEATWLDWALQQLGQRPFADLIPQALGGAE
jgi:hypothetical protein